jgi:hypothetical protein
MITVRLVRALSYLVYFWVMASLVILTLGFFLKLFAANPEAGFTEWVERNLDRTMEPFRGIFPDAPVGDTGSVFDTSILFAMIVYGLVAVGFRALLDWLTFRLTLVEAEVGESTSAPLTHPGQATPAREQLHGESPTPGSGAAPPPSSG